MLSHVEVRTSRTSPEGARSRRRAERSRGTAVVEVALLAPWIFFLFVGVLNFGFYAYALISVENAARAAATYTASNRELAANSDSACRYALAELSGLPNTRTLTSCNALPVQVTAVEGQCPSLDADSVCSTVSVTYQTIRMIPIPGLPGQLTITRFVQIRADES